MFVCGSSLKHGPRHSIKLSCRLQAQRLSYCATTLWLGVVGCESCPSAVYTAAGYGLGSAGTPATDWLARTGCPFHGAAVTSRPSRSPLATRPLVSARALRVAARAAVPVACVARTWLLYVCQRSPDRIGHTGPAFALPADAPESAALLEFYTHAGEVFWTLNITGGEDAASAKLVFGDPDVETEDGEGLVQASPPDAASAPASPAVSDSRFTLSPAPLQW